MKINPDYIFGIMSSIGFLFPNLVWIIYIPYLSFFTVSSSLYYLNKNILNNSIFIILLVSTTFLFEPTTTKYGLLFILNFIASLTITYAIKNKQFRIVFINSAAILLLFSFLVTVFLNPKTLYETNVDYIFNQNNLFLRQRNFFSEPALLGYWASFFFILSVKNNLKKSKYIFLFLFLTSTSVGALFYLTSSIALLQRKINLKRTFIFIIIVSLSIIVFREIIFNKFQSNSFNYRLLNFKLSFQYIRNYFPIPKGFGPMIFPNIEVGLLNFILLLIKAFGGLILIPILLNFQRIVNLNIFLLPALLMSFAVSNFWETPLILSFICLPYQLAFVREN